ncbi:MAG: hypothetical protein ACE5FU_03210, partial [Nitrospinota bacterium]
MNLGRRGTCLFLGKFKLLPDVIFCPLWFFFLLLSHDICSAAHQLTLTTTFPKANQVIVSGVVTCDPRTVEL